MNRSLLSLLTVALAAGSAAAQIHEGDVVLQTTSGSIETYASENMMLTADCVFTSNILSGSTNDPGFDNVNGTFGANQNVHLDILSHLRAWNGSAWIDAAPTQIRITRGFDGPVFSPSPGAGPALGFPVSANSSGKWHKHYLFTREGPSGGAAYAVELQLRTVESTPDASEPFWLVFNNGLDTAGLEAAVQAARDSLAACGSEPCPGDIADDLGVLGGDGQVSFGDFLALLGLVGPCQGGVPSCVGDIADDFGTLGGDGQVSFGDFLALLGLVGPCL